MKTFEKNYIGKGTQVANLSIVKFSFKLSEIAKLSHVFNGEDYITFEVAKLKNTDSFGHGYTAYVNKMVETPEHQASLVEDAPKKSTRKPKRTERQKRKLQFSLTTPIITCRKAQTNFPSKQPNLRKRALKEALFFCACSLIVLTC